MNRLLILLTGLLLVVPGAWAKDSSRAALSRDLAKIRNWSVQAELLKFLGEPAGKAWTDEFLNRIPAEKRSLWTGRLQRGSLAREQDQVARNLQRASDRILQRLSGMGEAEFFRHAAWLLGSVERQLAHDLPFSLHLHPLVEGLGQQARFRSVSGGDAAPVAPAKESPPAGSLKKRLLAVEPVFQAAMARDHSPTLHRTLERGSWPVDLAGFLGEVQRSAEFPPVAAETRPNGSVPTRAAPAAKPSSFLWGVSTSGYQWEGNIFNNQWYPLEKAGRYQDPAGKAANGRELWPGDLDRAAGLGCNTFRTSIEWARIEPAPGQISSEAVAFYHQLLQGMKQRGLTPVITLMHFSYPQWVQERCGGWENPATVEAFLKFVGFVAREFGAEIDWYLTFNEPTTFLGGVYLTGLTAPCTRGKIKGFKATLNLIKAHCRAYEIIHRHDPVAWVSFNHYVNLINTKPFGNIFLAVEGTGTQAVPEENDFGSSDDWVLQRFMGGGGQGGSRKYMDYFALDYYSRWSLPWSMKDCWDWEIYPEGFYQALKHYHRLTGLPILVAENGLGLKNLEPRPDGWTREAFLVHHIDQMQRAMAEGVPVLGYIHWSITDNWELGSFSGRFGLYSVDCRRQDFTRIPTPAVEVYRRIIRQGKVTPDLLEAFPRPSKP